MYIVNLFLIIFSSVGLGIGIMEESVAGMFICSFVVIINTAMIVKDYDDLKFERDLYKTRR